MEVMKRFFRVLAYVAFAAAVVFFGMFFFVGLSSGDPGMAAFGLVVDAVLIIPVILRRRKSRANRPRNAKPQDDEPVTPEKIDPDIHHERLDDHPASAVQVSEQHEEKAPEKPEKKKRTFSSYLTIDYVTIAGQESRTKAGSAIARGAVGGVLLGPVGLLAGSSAKKKTTVTLIIHYQDGHVETKTVKLDSGEFKRYARFIR